jgi:AcrR family transcriptional regulator
MRCDARPRAAAEEAPAPCAGGHCGRDCHDARRSCAGRCIVRRPPRTLENVSVGLGLRERKKAQTRETIAAAALELFGSRGFDATTVDDIALAASVSPRTFFRYFATKEDVLFSAGDDRRRQILDVLATRDRDEPPVRSLREAMRVIARDYEADQRTTLQRMKIARSTPSLRTRVVERQAEWEDAVTEALLSRSSARNQLDVRLLVAAAAAALRVVIDEWTASGGRGSLEQRIDNAFDQIVHGWPDPIS